MDRLKQVLDRRWRLLLLVAWLLLCAWLIYSRWAYIRGFILTDTDDNMRMSQVRAWLGGQSWFDLRQHKMNWPYGINIHWSRLVDLPIAGLILLGRLFMTGAHAEQMAVAVAPLIPLALMMLSLTLIVRRLVAPAAWPLAIACLFFAGSTMGMFQPTRIDHHNWQLALLALGCAGIADPRRARGGLILGLATALSLSIGLEMLIYLALLAAAAVLFWVDDPDERERMRAYAVALGGGTALAFLIFTSNDNRGAVCDALSPVWLSDALIGSALLYGVSLLKVDDWKKRFGLAVLAGLIVAGFHASMWPHCLQRLEGVSPEVDRLWLSHVKEARPFYRHGWRIATLIIALPITGLIGWGLLAWMRRVDRDLMRRVLGAMAPAFAATALLFWQTRTGPAAQMMTTVGCAALGWFFFPLAWNSKQSVVRILGSVLAVTIAAGAAVPFIVGFIPEEKAKPGGAAIGKANSLCGSMWGLRPVALQPKGVVFTFVDLGPRLITVTPHYSITGPYHRNGQQIADVMNTFRGSADQAHRLITKYHSNYLLICPNSSTTTIFMSEAPQGFYGQLQRNQVPKWLRPVDLGKDSPFRMWRVVG